MNRPQQSISLSVATARLKVMAGQYGQYPWSLSDAQIAYLRALSPMPEDLASALRSYDAALEGWRVVEQAMAATARAAPAGTGESEEQ